MGRLVDDKKAGIYISMRESMTAVSDVSWRRWICQGNLIKYKQLSNQCFFIFIRSIQPFGGNIRRGGGKKHLRKRVLTKPLHSNINKKKEIINIPKKNVGYHSLDQGSGQRAKE